MNSPMHCLASSFFTFSAFLNCFILPAPGHCQSLCSPAVTISITLTWDQHATSYPFCIVRLWPITKRSHQIISQGLKLTCCNLLTGAP